MRKTITPTNNSPDVKISIREYAARVGNAVTNLKYFSHQMGFARDKDFHIPREAYIESPVYIEIAPGRPVDANKLIRREMNRPIMTREPWIAGTRYSSLISAYLVGEEHEAFDQMWKRLEEFSEALESCTTPEYKTLKKLPSIFLAADKRWDSDERRKLPTPDKQHLAYLKGRRDDLRLFKEIMQDIRRNSQEDTAINKAVSYGLGKFEEFHVEEHMEILIGAYEKLVEEARGKTVGGRSC